MSKFPENAIISLFPIDEGIDKEDRNKEMMKLGKLWKVFKLNTM